MSSTATSQAEGGPVEAHCLLFATVDDSGLAEQTRSRGHTYVRKFGGERIYGTLCESVLEGSATAMARS